MKRYLDIPAILFVITILASSCATIEPAPMGLVSKHVAIIQKYEKYQDFIIYKMSLLKASRLLSEKEARNMFDEYNDIAWPYYLKGSAALAEGDVATFTRYLTEAGKIMKILEDKVDNIATSGGKKFVPQPSGSRREL